MLSWNVQLYCIREKKCRALHIISSYQRSKKRPTVTLSFSFKLHQLKHRWNIWWLTHITFKKRAYLLKNPPDLISIAFRIAEECCCQFSNPGYAISSFPAQPFSSASSQVLKMYTEQSLKWVWWSQLLYSIRSCEQHMLSRDVQLHCVRNKKAFICQKKSCETLHTVFILSKIQ